MNIKKNYQLATILNNKVLVNLEYGIVSIVLNYASFVKGHRTHCLTLFIIFPTSNDLKKSKIHSMSVVNSILTCTHPNLADCHVKVTKSSFLTLS